MSRIGKKIIEIPESVTVTLADGSITVAGPKGAHSLLLHRDIALKKDGNALKVIVRNPDIKKQAALWGLFRSIIQNMVMGVVDGFSKRLEINGIGFKGEVKKDILVLHVGYSHPVQYSVPKGIDIKVEKNILTVSGIDKQLVGQTAADIRAIKKPEPYKGKGIKYADEVLRRKSGKAAVKTE